MHIEKRKQRVLDDTELGSVQLVSLGTYASRLQVHNVNAPGYNPRLYR